MLRAVDAVASPPWHTQGPAFIWPSRRVSPQESWFNDFAHIPWEDTPNFPKPPQRKKFLHKLLVKFPGYLPGVCAWHLRMVWSWCTVSCFCDLEVSSEMTKTEITIYIHHLQNTHWSEFPESQAWPEPRHAYTARKLYHYTNHSSPETKSFWTSFSWGVGLSPKLPGFNVPNPKPRTTNLRIPPFLELHAIVGKGLN